MNSDTGPAGDLRPDRFCFVGGQGKSGTTWVQLLLDSHPDICCHGEGHPADVLAIQLGQAVDNHRQFIGGNNAAFPELRPYASIDEDGRRRVLRHAITTLLASQCAGPLPAVLADRTPANIEYIGLLNDLFPQARFVHVLRDPRDVAVSLWFHGQRTNPEWINSRYRSIDTLAIELAGGWASAVETVRRQARVLGERYREIRYEDLKSDFAATVGGLFEFLGVEAGAQHLAAAAQAGDFKRLAGGRDPGAENRDSHFRKGISGDWRNHLRADTVARISSRAGAALATLGYR